MNNKKLLPALLALMFLGGVAMAADHLVYMNDHETMTRVPIFVWAGGCVPSATSMVLGYWDNYGLDGTGPGNRSKYTQWGNLINYYIDYIAYEAMINVNAGHYIWEGHDFNFARSILMWDLSNAMGTNNMGITQMGNVETGIDAVVTAKGYPAGWAAGYDWNWVDPDELWDTRLAPEVDAGMPFIYSTHGRSGGGHAVCGWGYTDDKFVVNYNTWDELRSDWNYYYFCGSVSDRCDGWRVVTVHPQGGNDSDVELLYPDGGEYFLGGKPYDIYWKEFGSSIDSVDIYYSLNGGQTWSAIAAGVASAAGDNYYTWTPSTAINTCRARIRITGIRAGVTIAADGTKQNFCIGFNTPTVTPTFSISPTITRTFTDSPTFTVTKTGTPTFTATKTGTPTRTITDTRTATFTRTYTPTRTVTNTVTPTNTVTDTRTATFTRTDSPTFTATRTCTVTRTDSPTRTATPTHTITRTGTPTKTFTATPTATKTSTVTFTSTNTPSITSSWTASKTPTFTRTRTVTPTHTITRTWTKTPTWTVTAICTDTWTPSLTPVYTETDTLTPEDTATVTETVYFTATFTGTQTPTATETQVCTQTRTETATPVPTSTLFLTDTPSPVSTRTSTPTAVPTETHSMTATMTVTPSYSVTGTDTPQDTATITLTPSLTATPAASFTSTATTTPAATAGALVITGPVIYPNPLMDNTGLKVRFNITQQCGEAVLKIYTVSFRLVLAESLGACAAGTVEMQAPAASFERLGKGTYYCILEAQGVTGGKARSKPFILIILR